MKARSLLLILLLAGANAAMADLIFIGAVPISGAGLGAVNTALTFTSPANTTTESGCVAGGVGGVTVTGPTACPAGFTGGDEQAINQAYSASALGVTDFNLFQVIFNASEPQNPGDEGITIDSLALTLWDPATGLILDAKYTPAPVVLANTFPGVGNAGFGFSLDANQAGDFNLLLANFPNLVIGVAANASDATGGLETVSFRVTNTVIPEPGTYALLGSALLGLGLLRKVRR